jgi:RNA polymerase sigma factor (sigma-70 family)
MKNQLEILSDQLPFFRTIVNRNLPVRYHYLAEDVAQDAIIKAIENISKYDPRKGNFRSWLYRLTQNLCFDTYRKLERVQYVPLNREIFHLSNESRKLDRQEIRLARKALRNLCERDRMLIICRIIFEMSSKEIAVLTNIPEEQVNVYFRRARLRLQKVYLTAA